jgi:hypothetical protein
MKVWVYHLFNDQLVRKTNNELNKIWKQYQVRPSFDTMFVLILPL